MPPQLLAQTAGWPMPTHADPVTLRIFLSSTSADLVDVRREVMRFLRVIPGDVIAMECFASDEDAPKAFCLEQVGHANFFIGIYAQRYGFVDPETGQSITEIEYRRAEDMLARGEMLGLLVYVIDPDALWPIKFGESDGDSARKLALFKDHLRRRHVVRTFKDVADLPFFILHDVIRKVGIGERLLRPKRQAPIEPAAVLSRPIGMEYFTAEYARFFRGRTTETRALLKQLVSEPLSLLIGASGIGKTSLIRGGLAPELHALGWTVAIVRPLPQVDEQMRHQIWSQLMDGPMPTEFNLAAVIKACTAAHRAGRLAVIVDQFEDAVAGLAGNGFDLIASLSELRGGSEQNVRLLFSYRGDAEADVGPIWQSVSGSSGGLARLYLGPLARESARDALAASVQGPDTHEDRFLDSVAEDLYVESLGNGFEGVFPPFLQIVASSLVQTPPAFTMAQEYHQQGGARKIIAEFLISQLKHLGRDEAAGRQILVALVSSYARKAQKRIDEIESETGLDTEMAMRVVARLIDMRMVRAVGDAYEISHDFLARRILAEIVTAEEAEAKRCRELLELSRRSTYEQTGSLLTYREAALCLPAS